MVPGKYGLFSSGFTLIELLFTIGVMSILLTVAVPGFKTVLNRYAVTSTASEFVSSLGLARSEAVTRSRRVVVCKSIDGATCTDDASVTWSDGWLVFVDADGDGSVGAGDTILRLRGALDKGLSMTGNVPVANSVTYLPSGFFPEGIGNGTITLVNASKTIKIIFSNNGRVRTE